MLANTDGGYQAPTSAAGAAGVTSANSPYYAPPSGSLDAAGQYASADAAYKRALVRFNSQRTGLLRQYGYAGDIDPSTGMVNNLRVDGGNVHGALQELLGNQAGEDQNATYAAEDRGLHGGLAHQAESQLHFQHGGQTSNLAQTLLGNLTDLNSQQQDAHGTLDDALWQLQHQATTDAISNGDYNPADVSSIVDAPIVPTATAKKVAAVVKKQAAAPNTAAKALAARSAALNVKYGLNKPVANAYNDPKSKKKG